MEGAPIIKIAQGELSGSASKFESSGLVVYTYEDIPFAKSPRFEKPQDYENWDRTWDGKQATRPFPQPSLFDRLFENHSHLLSVQEKRRQICNENRSRAEEKSLHLSVATSDVKDKKPVMVWIHGGAWTVGAVDEYNPLSLVAMGDVVVVCLSYRLGPHGFLFGNWGLFDMIKGLEWVRDNIEFFGGDQNNVTIFGESAGGWAVDALMCSEKAVGLFHRAIAQSGTLKSTILKYVPTDQNPAFPFLCKEFGLESTEELKEKLTKMPTMELVKLGEQMDKARILYRYNLDDDFFNLSPSGTIIMPNKVPYMVGICDSEYSWLLGNLIPMGNPSRETICHILKDHMVKGGLPEALATRGAENAYQQMVDLYAASSPYAKDDENLPYYLFRRSLADQWFFGAFLRAEEICKDQNVFCYELCIKTKSHHKTEYSNYSEFHKEEWINADHADDIMYVFGHPFNGDSISGNCRFGEDEIELSKRMIKSWSDFARNGNPGWAKYDENKVIKEFNSTDSLKSGNEPNWQKRSDYVKHGLSCHLSTA